MNNEHLTLLEFSIRLFSALGLGAAIGIERQWRLKSAGLRTNTLVSLGSAAYILLSIGIYNNGGGDPSRIAAQVVTGIGFLGAGVIMKEGFNIQGLNTAATIWCSAAVGLLAGMGMYKEAAISTVAIIMSHLVMRPIGRKLSKIKSYRIAQNKETTYELTILCNTSDERKVRNYIIKSFEPTDKHLLRSIARKEMDNPPDEILLTFELSTIGKQEVMLETIITNLTLETKVKRANWKYLDMTEEY